MKVPTVTIRKEILEAWLRVSGCSKAKLARQLGVTKGRVSQLLHNDTEPSAHLIAKLLVLTDLPFERLFEVRRIPAARPARARMEAAAA